MKKTILFLPGLLVACTTFSPEVISTQGEEYNNALGSVSFTIGEPVTETVSAGNYDLTQGFQQPNLTVNSVGEAIPGFSVKVFPNPTAKRVQLTVLSWSGLTFRITDLNGALIRAGWINSRSTELDFTDQAAGTYLLSVFRGDDQIVSTFKVIKAE